MDNTGATAARVILIVDDDYATRNLMTFALTQKGYEIRAVNDISAALRELQNVKPDLLITDIRLEGYNGLQLLAMAPDPIPAIVVTGFADPAIEADARRLGAEYLVKPVSPSALCTIVARKLEAAAQHETFSCARRWARTHLRPSVPVQIGDLTARLLDVSEGGARIHVDTVVGAGMPRTLSLAIEPAAPAVPLEIVWKRRLTDKLWECGAAVGEDARTRWTSSIRSLIRPSS